MRYLLLLPFLVLCLSGCANPADSLKVKGPTPIPPAKAIGGDGTDLVRVQGQLHQNANSQMLLCTRIQNARCQGPRLVVVGLLGDENIRWNKRGAISFSAPLHIQGYVTGSTMKVRQISTL